MIDNEKQKKLFKELVEETEFHNVEHQLPHTVRPSLILKKESNSPRHVTGIIWRKKGPPTCGLGETTAEATAWEFFEDYGEMYGMVSPTKELSIKPITSEREDRPRVRYVQMYHGYRVNGASIRVRFKRDDIVGIDSNYLPSLAVDINEKIGPEEAGKSALEHDKKNREFKSSLGERVILNLRTGPKATWRVRVRGKEETELRGVEHKIKVPAVWDYFIDVRSGEVIGRENKVRAQNYKNMMGAQGTGIGYYAKGSNSLNCTFENGKYLLRDVSGGQGFVETRIGTSDLEDQCTVSEDADGTWDDPTQASQVDCYLNTKEVEKYFNLRFGRKSYDNRSSPMVVLAGYSPGSEEGNGSWCIPDKDPGASQTESYYILIGEGDGTANHPWCTPDLIAHEWTHALINSEVFENLRDLESDNGHRYDITQDSRDQWGSLQEAICDSFAAFITREWRIGLGVNFNMRPMRDLQDPPQSRKCKLATTDEIAKKYYKDGLHPDHMRYYYMGNWDGGGEHLNSTIVGKATFLMTKGGTHNGIDCASGLGWEVAEEVYYRVVRGFLLPFTSFEEFRGLVIEAADDIFADEGQSNLSEEWRKYYLEVINNSFAAVGIGNPGSIPIEPSKKPPKWSFIPLRS